MSTIKSFATVALAGLFAAPLSAQITARSDSTVHERVEAARRRAGRDSTIRERIEAARRRGDVYSTDRATTRGSRIPPGQLPPKGMCRVWIDGVPPGQQPPVTDCATAEANRTANSRVIYGDRESFPGKGKGKFKRGDGARASRQCSVRDAVVVDGRVINVCRDSTFQNDRRGRVRRDDDDDRFENDDDDRGKSAKLSKSEKHAAKAAHKGNRGRGK